VSLSNPPATLPVIGRDRRAVAAMLGRAFADDPAFSWIFPDPDDRARRLPWFFAMLLDSGMVGGMALRSAECDAASLWLAPGPSGPTGRLKRLRRAWPL